MERLFEKGRKLLEEKVPRDAVIRIGDIKFDVHKKFLLLWSPYFKALFSTNWSNNQIYDLDEKFYDTNVFKTLIQYLYTGKIVLKFNECYNLCVMADYFQLPALIKLCEKTLVENVKSSEISDLMKMVDLSLRIGMKDLEETVRNFFIINGRKILDTHEFSNCDLEDFSRILSEVLFYWNYPRMKEKCFNKIIDWIQHDLSNRQNFLENLISEFICFKEFSPEFLNEKVSKIDLIRNSHKLNEELLEAMKKVNQTKVKEVAHNSKLYYACPSYGNGYGSYYQFNFSEVNSVTGETIVSNSIISKQSLPPSSVFDKKIYVGGDKAIHVYDCRTNTWQNRIFFKETLQNVGMVCLNGCIYIAGYYFLNSGVRDSLNVQQFWRYSIETKQWKSLKSSNTIRGKLKFLTLNNCIYAFEEGGRTFERYNIETDAWEYISHPDSSIYSFKTTAHNGSIYVLDGKFLKIYNPQKDVWIYMKSFFPAGIKPNALISFNHDLLAIKQYKRSTAYSRIPSFIFRFNFYSYQWQVVDNMNIFYSEALQNIHVVDF